MNCGRLHCFSAEYNFTRNTQKSKPKNLEANITSGKSRRKKGGSGFGEEITNNIYPHIVRLIF